MTTIPKSHPRAKSLVLRESLVKGFEQGLVATEGLLAQGRGEAFDYLIGEKTNFEAKKAIKAAAAVLLLAKNPIISVNGNFVALCSKEIIRFSKISKAKIEINLFYDDGSRRKRIAKFLKSKGAKVILGHDIKHLTKIPKLKSNRGRVDKRGISSADVVLVPLEDGDRTSFLKKLGKTVITFDLNPLSRTAQTADITVVDNISRGFDELINTYMKLSKRNMNELENIIQNFDNKTNLANSIMSINKNLRRRARKLA
ncbi:MAG: phosphopantothenate/pantothenate synthetase [Nitrosopumilaceae archaeon]|nr:phosphopantothenate/pantothenate synthetase [Nitrosopumilaceae archaeon]NIU00809.1 phosphopantothenate/pantothenate synthetase [Nitrosopumilaceae archaeon]NIU87262.1 phosphopantothenate/pantothenate synthetase [Nitrosopumilaceae archaeon]NIV65790.1 phosphopantothenate/pantothenate synthetase [Nitrosopumilaceae archaeon]NIX61411.1 phosphopantothenate/pantothenate synthetase [Nitrosopumilaceae archaeon]